MDVVWNLRRTCPIPHSFNVHALFWRLRNCFDAVRCWFSPILNVRSYTYAIS